MKTKKQFYTSFAILAGALILLNFIFSGFSLRLDLTADKRFTLSDATKDILKTLPEPVTITAYYSKEVPPEVARVRKRLKEVLNEYSGLSKGMLKYEFKDPSKDADLEREAMEAGVQPILLGSGEKDQVTQQKAFLGLVIEAGEGKKEIIPVIYNTEGLEYELSSNIKKLTMADKKSIALLQGHGEPSLNSMPEVYQQLSVMYSLTPIYLSDSTDNLATYDGLLMIAPKDSIAPFEFQQIDRFMGKGKGVLIAMNKVGGDFQTLMGTSINTGLEAWLASKGIFVDNNFVLDQNCANIGVMQQFGGMRMQVPVSFPYLPIFSNFTKHPIVSGLEAIMFEFASPIRFEGDTSKINYSPLILSSEKSGTEVCPVRFNPTREWNENDFLMKNITVGAAFNGLLGTGANTVNSKMVLFSDGDFPVSGDGQQRQRINPDNVNLLANSVEWLSDETGLAELRTKGVTSRPIEEMEDGKKSFIRWFNFIAPILLIIIYGIIRLQRNRLVRIKRMEGSYV